MQDHQNPIEYPGKCRTGFCFFGFVIAIQNRFNHFDIPVAERAPNKLINSVGSIGKAEVVQIFGQLGSRLLNFGDNPAVNRVFDFIFIKALRQLAPVHLAKTGGVPQFGGKIAITLNTGFRNIDITPLGFHRGHKEAQRIGTVFLDNFHRINRVTFGL